MTSLIRHQTFGRNCDRFFHRFFSFSSSSSSSSESKKPDYYNNNNNNKDDNNKESVYEKSFSALNPTSDEFHGVLQRVSQDITQFLKKDVEEHHSSPADVDDVLTRHEVSFRAAEMVKDHGIPWKGSSLNDVLDVTMNKASFGGLRNDHGGLMGFIPGGGCVYTGVADLIADCLNRFTGMWVLSPGMVQLEINVIRWMCKIFQLGDKSFGQFTSGSSYANMSAIIVARRNRFGDDVIFRKGKIFTSNQTHFCVRKEAVLAGFSPSNIVEIPVDENFRIRIDVLRQEIDKSVKDGFIPFMIVGSAGTTNTGAIDDLVELREISNKYNCFFHVDAAYAGFFYLTERGKKALNGITNADSISLDFHKSFFLPYGTGLYLIKKSSQLKRAMDVSTGEYLPSETKFANNDDEDDASKGDIVNFYEYSPELSRPCYGYRVWFPLKLLGVDAFASILEKRISQAEYMEKQISAIPGVELVAKRQLTVFAFRAKFPSLKSLEEENEFNKKLLTAINSRHHVFLSSTTLNKKFVIRVVILHLRTTDEIIDDAINDIRQAIKSLQ